MVFAIIGESCVGKSTLAARLKEILPAEVYTGRDYLRLAKNEASARELFQAKLQAAANGDGHVIYIISEPEHLRLLPEAALRVVLSVDLGTIQTRFAARMGGKLPPPLASALARKHGMFDQVDCDLRLDGANTQPEEACRMIVRHWKEREF